MNDKELTVIRSRDILERTAFARIIELCEDKNPFIRDIDERLKEIQYIAETEFNMINNRWDGTLTMFEESKTVKIVKDKPEGEKKNEKI